MKKTVTRYLVMIADNCEIIKSGFKTWRAADEWAAQIDYGQYENDGGLVICPYTV